MIARRDCQHRVVSVGGKRASTGTIRFFIGLMAATVVTLSAHQANATPVFADGDFEAVTVAGGWFTSMTSANAPGWTISPASVFPIITRDHSCGGSYGAGSQGCQFAVLGGGETGGAGSIQQTLTGFTVGSSYKLNWLQSSEGDVSSILVRIIGASTLSSTFTTPTADPAVLWNNWQSEQFSFVADSTSLTFIFNGLGGSCPGGCDPGVDAFTIAGTTVAPVPEPATMTLTALGLAAAIARYRRRSAGSNS